MWENSKLAVKTKMAVYIACVISTLRYEIQTRTIYVKQEKILKTFYLKCICCNLGISWKVKVYNTEVLFHAA